MTDGRSIHASSVEVERAVKNIGTLGTADGIDAIADDQRTTFDALVGPSVISPPLTPIAGNDETLDRGNLCESGFPDELLTGGWDELRGLIRGSFN